MGLIRELCEVAILTARACGALVLLANVVVIQVASGGRWQAVDDGPRRVVDLGALIRTIGPDARAVLEQCEAADLFDAAPRVLAKAATRGGASTLLAYPMCLACVTHFHCVWSHERGST